MCRKAHVVAVQAVNPGVSWLPGVWLYNLAVFCQWGQQPVPSGREDCLITPLSAPSLCLCLLVLSTQQIVTFVPISITDQPKKRSLLKMRSQSRKKTFSYSSLEIHIALLGHQGAWRGCKCTKGLKCVGCGAWLV